VTRFATVEELGFVLGQAVPDEDAERAAFAIQMASAIIQSEYPRFTFDGAVEDEEFVVHGEPGPAILLPHLPVIEVSEVDEDGTILTEDTDYTLLPAGIIQRYSRLGWGTVGLLSRTIITFTYGYETVPDDVKRVCLTLAKRWYSNPTGVQAESITNYSRQFGSEDRYEESELESLSRYRMPV
jgi:hypothetical protein